jgi:hypothetical protein
MFKIVVWGESIYSKIKWNSLWRIYLNSYFIAIKSVVIIQSK